MGPGSHRLVQGHRLFPENVAWLCQMGPSPSVGEPLKVSLPLSTFIVYSFPVVKTRTTHDRKFGKIQTNLFKNASLSPPRRANGGNFWCIFCTVLTPTPQVGNHIVPCSSSCHLVQWAFPGVIESCLKAIELPLTCRTRTNHPANTGHAVCFQFVTIINKAAINLFVHNSLWQFLGGGSRGHRERNSF